MGSRLNHFRKHDGYRVNSWHPGERADPWLVILAVRRLHYRLEAMLDEVLTEMGVSFAQYLVLELVREDSNLHGGEIARRMGISRQAVHGLLRKLCLAGLVERLPRDFGVRGLQLTRDGQRRILHCRAAVASVEDCVAELPPDPRDALIQALVHCDQAVKSLAVRRRSASAWWD